MSDLIDAIRARHEHGAAPLPHGVASTCDTAVVIAALDAVLARERRLREAIHQAHDDLNTPDLEVGYGYRALAVLNAALAETTEPEP